MLLTLGWHQVLATVPWPLPHKHHCRSRLGCEWLLWDRSCSQSWLLLP